MNKLLMLILIMLILSLHALSISLGNSFPKLKLNAWRNNEITIKLPITDIFGCRKTVKVRNDVIFKQWL